MAANDSRKQCTDLVESIQYLERRLRRKYPFVPLFCGDSIKTKLTKVKTQRFFVS